MNYSSLKKSQLVNMLQSMAVQESASQVSTPESAAALARGAVYDWRQENVIAVYLNTQRQPILTKLLFVGTLNACTVHPREVFAHAISSRAESIIFAHNHPTTSLNPSNADIVLASLLVAAGKLLSIEVLDSIIISPVSFRSFQSMIDEKYKNFSITSI